MVDKTEAEYELLYWPGNFAGRGEYIRLMLECCGKELGSGYRDVGREEGGMQTILALFKMEQATPYPVLFCPYLKHKGTIFCQLAAIMQYLGQVNGLAPTDPVD